MDHHGNDAMTKRPAYCVFVIDRRLQHGRQEWVVLSLDRPGLFGMANDYAALTLIADTLKVVRRWRRKATDGVEIWYVNTEGG